jgi:hypothetical protein
MVCAVFDWMLERNANQIVTVQFELALANARYQ